MRSAFIGSGHQKGLLRDCRKLWFHRHARRFRASIAVNARGDFGRRSTSHVRASLGSCRRSRPWAYQQTTNKGDNIECRRQLEQIPAWHWQPTRAHSFAQREHSHTHLPHALKQRPFEMLRIYIQIASHLRRLLHGIYSYCVRPALHSAIDRPETNQYNLPTFNFGSLTHRGADTSNCGRVLDNWRHYR